MKIKIIFLIFFLSNQIYSQEYKTNFNINLENIEIKSIVDLWQNYLKTNSKNFWNNEEVKDLINYNVLDMSGILNPSIMNWNFKNSILSINKIDEKKYLIKSIFETDNNDVFAITNVIAVKNKNEFKLSNYLFEYTKNWNFKESKNINYLYINSHNLIQEDIDEAEVFYSKLCAFFDVKPEKTTYYIAKDCDNIYEAIGYEWIFSKGNSLECGYFESKNNFIFATQKSGGNHYHEITHFINKFYPNANELLLTGISAYISKDKAHLDKSLIYHTKRVNEYLKQHSEIELTNVSNFNYLDENTNPQYVIGAILCEIIAKKGGKKLLISAFDKTSTDEDLATFFKEKILKKNENLNTKLKELINEIALLNEFPNSLKF